MTIWNLTITGLTCATCAKHLDKALWTLPGVTHITTDWAQGRSQLSTTADLSSEQVVRAVEREGYHLASIITGPPGVVGQPASTVVVLGTGAAAMAAALHLAKAGQPVTVIERGTIGGTCVNVGCVPSKTLIRAAETLHRARHSAFDGILSHASLGDFAAVAAQRDHLVSDLRKTKYVDVLHAHPQITVLRGEARFSGPQSLQVAELSLRFDRCLIATGSSPFMPDIPGLAAADPLDSASALALTTLPKRMVVLGGRIIALELAQAFARLGVTVTIVQRSARILPDQDEDLTERLTNHLRAEGITIITSAQVQRVETSGNESRLYLSTADGQQTLITDRILVAMGRRANAAALHLDQAGITGGDDGCVVVDDQLRTSNPAVFAAGDVIGDPTFVYTAAYEGRLAAANMLGGTKRRDYTALPSVVFTDPQVAVVGLTESEATRRGIPVEVARIDLAQVPRALAARDHRGFLKLIKERGGDRLLGAVFLAPEAGDLIMEPTMAIRHGIGISQLIDTFHPYLTQAEGVRLAAQLFNTDVSRLSCCA